MSKVNKLKSVKTKIELMSKNHQVEVLRILTNIQEVSVNENKNGSFINLTEVSSDTIKLLEDYILYVEKQENQLNHVENEKERIQNVFFNDNKDNKHKDKDTKI